MLSLCFFFNDTATTEIYTLSYTTLFRSLQPQVLLQHTAREELGHAVAQRAGHGLAGHDTRARARRVARPRSEEHTSELQSPDHLVCRLLLEKKKRRCTSRVRLHSLPN